LFGDDDDDNLSDGPRNDKMDGGSGTNTCVTDADDKPTLNCEK